MITGTKQGEVIIKSLSLISTKSVIILTINLGALLSFTVIFMYFLGPYVAEFNDFFKAFLALSIFTLRNNLFRDLQYFDLFTTIVFFISYVILITIVGCFLQVIFSDTVRNVFLLSDDNFVEGAYVSKNTFKNVFNYIFCCNKEDPKALGYQQTGDGKSDSKKLR